MKTKINLKRSAFIYLIAVSLLIIPALGMQFSNEVNWSLSDFLIAGIILLIAASMVNIILTFIHTKLWKIILLIISFFIIAIIWAELAVGIFGSPFAGS